MDNKYQLEIKDDGWLIPTDNVNLVKSPNHDERPANEDPSLLVIHSISLPPNRFSGNAVIDFFQNKLDFDSHPWFENIKGITVSSHFFIRRNGQIIQFVATNKRAWHAGLSTFNGRTNCNDFSIGIELEGSDYVVFDNAQYIALQALINAICARHPITDIQGHQHIAPGRKTDPGPFFDWQRISLNN